MYKLLTSTGLVQVPYDDYEEAYRSANSWMLQTGVCWQAGYRQTVLTHLTKQLEILGNNRSEQLPSIADGFFVDASKLLARNSLTLQRLSRRNYYLAVVSNNYGNTAGWCDEFRISHFFQHILDSARLGVRKPNPLIFQAALNRCGMDASQVAFVGDNYRKDIVGAKQAGFLTIWIGCDKEPGSYPFADWRISSVRELPDILGG